MKRRWADRREWRRILERRFAVARLAGPEFSGYVTLLALDRFAEPFWAQVGEQRCCLAASGYSWLQQFPEGAQHTVTTMFDAGGNVLQWYIDICRQHGCDEDGVPWFDDLYLDIVVTPSGAAHLLDADELEQAMHAGLVSPADSALAWAEARRLQLALTAGDFPLLKLSAVHRGLLLENLAARPHPPHALRP